MKVRTLSTLAAAAGVVAAGLLAGPAAAAPHQTTYCAVNLDTQKRACAQSQDRARQLVGSLAVEWVVKMYDGTGFSNYLDTFYKSGNCTATYSDTEIGLTDLGPTLDNKITSLHTNNQCDVKLYGKTGYGGAASTWIDESSNLANIGDGWNNRASSMKVS